MLNDNFVTFEIGKAKHIALVAHDGKKNAEKVAKNVRRNLNALKDWLAEDSKLGTDESSS